MAAVAGVDDDAPQLEPQGAREGVLSGAGMLSGLGDFDAAPGAAPRTSMMSRFGLASWEVVASTSALSSSTTRVMPGLVSAARMRFTSLSSRSSE
jgi:hypothetical protein